MQDQFIADPQALHLFFTEDVYLVPEARVQAGDAEALPVDDASDTAAEMTGTPVEPVTPEISETVPAKAREFKYLGNNKRNVLILVNSQSEQVSNEKGRELLRKIVKSVNLAAADFALLNYAGYPETDFSELAAFFNPEIVFSFGVGCNQLGLPDHALYTVVTEGSVKLIFSAGLEMLDDDMQAKKILWGALKQLEL
ncbi:hypothetical protein [Pedobacter sp. JY14-1]|uniref:hypothetical protein n=1 Tax=Pedobacter sp. JY14-1 TaxID=3034151 RepID=UPI0023E23E72|nr:hypothetical protein [Pedobacter sp. JY14-1]